MRNIDRIRAMSQEELAGFLAETCAEPPRMCEGCERDRVGYDCCGPCVYKTEEAAWNAWLERKVTNGKEKESG